jgi:hypothetical protein
MKWHMYSLARRRERKKKGEDKSLS